MVLLLPWDLYKRELNKTGVVGYVDPAKKPFSWVSLLQKDFEIWVDYVESFKKIQNFLKLKQNSLVPYYWNFVYTDVHSLLNLKTILIFNFTTVIFESAF